MADVGANGNGDRKRGDGDAPSARWEAMSDAGNRRASDDDARGKDARDSRRILSQDEIDALLGFSEETDGTAERSGIRAILNRAPVSCGRLPMLEVVFDRLARGMSTSLRHFTSDNVEVTLDTIESLRFGDYLDTVALPAMLAVFKAEEWDDFGVLSVDSSLIYSIVDVLLGGRRTMAARRTEGRPYTTIERNLVERMVHVVLSDLSAAFDPLSPVRFRFDRLETNPRFATISRHANAVAVAKLRVDMEGRGGQMELVLPYATLEPVRELLLQMFMGERFGRDSIWETHLAEELWLTDVQLEAVLDEQVMSLHDILDLTVGSRILLNATSETPVVLRCGDVPMFHGQMGRKGASMAIRVDGRIRKEKG